MDLKIIMEIDKENLTLLYDALCVQEAYFIGEQRKAINDLVKERYEKMLAQNRAMQDKMTKIV